MSSLNSLKHSHPIQAVSNIKTLRASTMVDIYASYFGYIREFVGVEYTGMLAASSMRQLNEVKSFRHKSVLTIDYLI